MRADIFRKSGWVMGLAGALVLAACGEREEILPGKRENLRAVLSDELADMPEAVVEDRSVAVQLPAVQSNANWTQRPGTPATRVSHPAFGGAMQMMWRAPIGQGDSRRKRVTADPVVAGGRIYTLDAEARVTATATNGETVWTADLVPPRDAPKDASGGGLAYGDGAVFVSSSFGLLTALDAATGQQLWQQKLQATGSGTPTFLNGVVYLVAGDTTAWAIDAKTGRINWQLDSTPSAHNVMGGPAPAVNERVAIFAFGSGEVQAAFRGGGLRLWDSVISGRRSGITRSRVTDITGDPVIVGNTVYVGSHSGRLIALNAGTGERLWTAEEGPLNPVWVAGGSVFLVSDQNELVRLNAEDGSRIWGKELPFFVKNRPRRQKEIFLHYGPVLAGGRLIVASGDGLIRAFDPVSGDLTATAEIPGGATSNPVFAGGVMYVVSRNGELYAFR
ncbi:PQQ-like beta-propeller repeat protein [Marimonas lutisalis]|uniref:PQQ-like beta-propeller repeat protein n=1 Tax=Marimonas lutisalis TaxID=2545756 RepID=UPI001F184AFA|nr:PQQ-like beta-propeller repeat protein [Marimonas lutisalis]